ERPLRLGADHVRLGCQLVVGVLVVVERDAGLAPADQRHVDALGQLLPGASPRLRDGLDPGVLPPGLGLGDRRQAWHRRLLVVGIVRGLGGRSRARWATRRTGWWACAAGW